MRSSVTGFKLVSVFTAALIIHPSLGWGGTVDNVPTSPPTADDRHLVEPDRLLTTLPNGRQLEILIGHAADEHLQNLLSRRGPQYAKAHALMQARGWKPAHHAVIMRTLRAIPMKGSIHQSPGIAYVQSTPIDIAEGEVVFESWDDGDPTTWEGTMYAWNYSTGGEALHEGQFDTIVNDALWEDAVWSHPGDPAYRDVSFQERNQPMTHAAKGLRSSRSGPVFAQFSGKRLMRDWLICVAFGLGSVLIQCSISGPLYVECIAAGFAATVIYCAWQAILGNL